MAKKHKKTDFGDLDERVKRARAFIARKDEELRRRRERESAEPKRS